MTLPGFAVQGSHLAGLSAICWARHSFAACHCSPRALTKSHPVSSLVSDVSKPSKERPTVKCISSKRYTCSSPLLTPRIHPDLSWSIRLPELPWPLAIALPLDSNKSWDQTNESRYIAINWDDTSSWFNFPTPNTKLNFIVLHLHFLWMSIGCLILTYDIVGSAFKGLKGFKL